jgi:Enoyl-CoA hydratase/isomerase
MAKVLYERDGRIARITLNRPEVMNAIDDELPGALADAVARADNDPGAHVIVLAGAGRAFCAGYDLTAYASGDKANRYTQEMPWDPMKDYAGMSDNTNKFMSLFRSKRPVICARIQVDGESSALFDRDGNFLRDHRRNVRIVFGIAQHELQRMLAGWKLDPGFGLTRPKMKM